MIAEYKKLVTTMEWDDTMAEVNFLFDKLFETEYLLWRRRYETEYLRWDSAQRVSVDKSNQPK